VHHLVPCGTEIRSERRDDIALATALSLDNALGTHAMAWSVLHGDEPEVCVIEETTMTDSVRSSKQSTP
jgi:hypothetical protein